MEHFEESAFDRAAPPVVMPGEHVFEVAAPLQLPQAPPLQLSPVPDLQESCSFAADIATGMRAPQKFIPCKYLYDAVGSALFEAITHLKEYACTRGEMRIIARHARELFSMLPEQLQVAELGGGSGQKAAVLLSTGDHAHGVDFHNIDISQAAIEVSRRTLSALPGVRFHGHAGEFVEGLRLASAQRAPGQALLVLFLGSSIGNFAPQAAADLLRRIRRCMSSGDYLLLGADLVKPKARLLRAYDDPQGVTAAFNKNLLARINRELDADFDLSKFRHQSRWHDHDSKVEMHLVSTCRQQVHIKAAGVRANFARGESIHTESSYKYRAHEIGSRLAPLGFTLARQWIDGAALFATSLFAAQ